MFKWIRGFGSGVLLTIYVSTIGLMAFYVWLLKDIKTTKYQAPSGRTYYGYRRKEGGEK